METPEQAGAPVEGAAIESSAPSVDFSPIESRMNELASGLGDMRSMFEQHFQPQQEEPEDPWASLYGEEPEPDPEPALNVDALRQALQAEVQQSLGPLHEQLAALQSQNDMARLTQDFPELNDPEIRKETGQAARALAEQIAGAESAHVLTSNREFISLVRKAMVADQHAASEVPAGGDPNTLESGGGLPGGQQDEPSIVQQVLANRRSLPKGLA